MSLGRWGRAFYMCGILANNSLKTCEMIKVTTNNSEIDNINHKSYKRQHGHYNPDSVNPIQ